MSWLLYEYEYEYVYVYVYVLVWYLHGIVYISYSKQIGDTVKIYTYIVVPKKIGQ